MRFYLIIFSIIFLNNIFFAQSRFTGNTLKFNEAPLATEADIDDIAWIAGSWTGKALGGICEEIWAPPSAGSMVGMFKLIKDDQVVFYEILTISKDSLGLILRLKHFDKNLTGWEEREKTIDFPLVKVEENAAYFEGMTFKKMDDNSLKIFLAIQNKNNEVNEVEFAYTRK